MSAVSGLPPRVAIFGATSDIAVAVGRLYAEGGARLLLIGRDSAALAAAARDLEVRGAHEVRLETADFIDIARLSAVAQAGWDAYGGLDVALVAYGSLPDQAAVEASAEASAQAVLLNFTSPSVLLGELANLFERQRSGTIAAITSVAGDRGRQSNYVYGASKGGLQLFLEGLRHRLYRAGVAVVDIRPGFVVTKMTAHLPHTGLLWAQPEKVAADIVAAIAARRSIIYTPWFWRVILVIVRALPRPLFHRTKL